MNPPPDRFPVVLLWHMHQPEYRIDGSFRLPWVYAHALKDYTDMAAHLEAVPQARAVINFSPALLEQIDDYVQRLDRHLLIGEPVGDPLLDALSILPPPGCARAQVARLCLRTDSPRQSAQAGGGYATLVAGLGKLQEHELAELSDQTLERLLVGWHLAWTGESVFATDPALAALRGQADVAAGDRRTLLLSLAALLRGLLARYRALAERGCIELSMSPYHHPVLPLLLDFEAAREARPETPLPDGGPYPGGIQRAQWHLTQGRSLFERLLGAPPAGCWPAEAALSEAALRLLDGLGYAWTASSQGVLEASLRRSAVPAGHPHARYRSGDGGISVFFRDDELSDRIGFVYKDWPADAAVADLVSRLEQVARIPGRRLVLLALDGENPWAHYPANGADFLRGLYRTLAAHPLLRMATLAELAKTGPAEALPPLQAGSWVGADLQTWIGHPDKNRLWSWLIAVKHRYDAAGAATPELERLLGVCEASDWFWWPGSAAAGHANEFDELFRDHLRALYRALGIPAPQALAQPPMPEPGAATVAGAAMRASRD